MSSLLVCPVKYGSKTETLAFYSYKALEEPVNDAHKHQGLLFSNNGLSFY